ncbi:MAG: hypothetical protein KC910_11520 [Candidatus Eremiobacteraeota bacterium]|nr:hypothetical protein [Candidatus Eremiobacteraeota bacterium]
MILGCIHHPTIWQSFYFWLESIGLTQSLLVFCLVLMSLASAKTLLMTRLGWAEAADAFKWSALSTLISLKVGLYLFGVQLFTDPSSLTSFWALTSLVEGGALALASRRASEVKPWLLSLLTNTAAVALLVPFTCPPCWCAGSIPCPTSSPTGPFAGPFFMGDAAGSMAKFSRVERRREKQRVLLSGL